MIIPPGKEAIYLKPLEREGFKAIETSADEQTASDKRDNRGLDLICIYCLFKYPGSPLFLSQTIASH